MHIKLAYRSGQALMELAIGMLALAMVVGLLCSVAGYCVKSLEVQNSARGSSPQSADRVRFQVPQVIDQKFDIDEKAVMPDRMIPR